MFLVTNENMGLCLYIQIQPAEFDKSYHFVTLTLVMGFNPVLSDLSESRVVVSVWFGQMSNNFLKIHLTFVVYFGQFVIGIIQCHHKSEEVRLKSEVLSTTISHYYDLNDAGTSMKNCLSHFIVTKV